MDARGIGTDASMAVHIANIVSRRYVDTRPGEEDGDRSRYMVPTVLGMQLIKAFLEIDPSLVLPPLRASMEREILKIATCNRRSSTSHKACCP